MKFSPWIAAIAGAALCAACGSDESGSSWNPVTGDAGAMDAADAKVDAVSIDATKDTVVAVDSSETSAPEAGEDAAVDASSDPQVDSPPPETDIDQIPWNTAPDVGYGVASKDTDNPLGNNFFIAYAGYNVDLEGAKAWATALYRSTLHDRGVRHVWAVQGPNTSGYTNWEIGNSKIIAAMLPKIDASTKFVLAVGHSSGSFVAHELLTQLDSGLDPGGITNGLVVYFNLDGGGGLSASAIQRLRRAYFVGAYMSNGDTWSPNATTMQSLGSTYASSGGYWQYDANGSGCNAGAQWCVHVTLINTQPHDPAGASAGADYGDFSGRPVCDAYITAKAAEAGL